MYKTHLTDTDPVVLPAAHPKKTFSYVSARYSNRFGFLIREERRSLGLTQVELGQLLGISPSYVSSIERGKRNASAALLKKLHETFQLSYDYLLIPPEAPIGSTALKETPSAYGGTQKLDTLLRSCSPHEREVCYRLCQTYLLVSRSQEANLPS